MSSQNEPHTLGLVIPKPSPHVSTYNYELLNPGQIRLLEIVVPACVTKVGALIPEDVEVRIRIYHGELSACDGAYTALSYVWGDATKTKEIVVETDTAVPGPIVRQKLTITQSLHSFLIRLQATDRSTQIARPIRRFLWADGICINQAAKDGPFLAERERQVQQMAQIYRNAGSVCGDLGDMDEHAIFAFPLITDIVDAASQAMIAGRYDKIEEEEYTSFGLPASDAPDWTAWVKFLTRPWFRRMWIIQEYVLAREGCLLCGMHQIEWDALPLLIMMMTQHGLDEQTRFLPSDYNYPDMEKSRKSADSLVLLAKWAEEVQAGECPSLLDALTHTTRFEMTDARDRFYALLGICKPTKKPDPETYVSYKETLYEVSQRFTRSIIRDDHDPIRILYYCGGLDKNLPSWCPDWAGKRDAASYLGPSHGMPEDSVYAAGGKAVGPAAMRLTPNGQYLMIKGIAVEAVWRMGPLLTTGWQPESDKENLNHTLRWESSCRSWATTMWTQAELKRQKGANTPQELALLANYQQLEILKVKYGTTVIAGCVDDNRLASDADSRNGLAALDRARLGTSSASPNHSKSKEGDLVSAQEQKGGMGLGEYAVRTIHEEGGITDTTYTSSGHIDNEFVNWSRVFTQYLSRINVSARGRKIFVTDKGRLGLCPAETEAGDVVAVIVGAAVPLLLRRHQDYYSRIVGTLYVDGLMNGEGLRHSDHLIQGFVIG